MRWPDSDVFPDAFLSECGQLPIRDLASLTA